MKLLLLTQNGCNPCTMVKNYFNDEGVDYEMINVSEDESALDKYSIMSAPVTILFDGEEEVARVVGYRPNELEVLVSQL